MENTRGLRGKSLFCGLGWLLALLLGCHFAPQMYHRLFSRLPAVQREGWRQTLAGKQRELSSPWQDQRPLVILAGDSHIELGNWYDLFVGKWAVRNCGLSRAKIADVTQLVSAIGDQHPRAVVLMCGFNDLGAGKSHESRIHDFEVLIDTVRSHLNPESIIVLSVMPLRESVVDRTSHQFTITVNRFNAALVASCQRQQVEFLDVNPAVTDAGGGLDHELTIDGLHLNPAGYHRLAAIIAPHLPQPTNAP